MNFTFYICFPVWSEIDECSADFLNVRYFFHFHFSNRETLVQRWREMLKQPSQSFTCVRHVLVSLVYKYFLIFHCRFSVLQISQYSQQSNILNMCLLKTGFCLHMFNVNQLMFQLEMTLQYLFLWPKPIQFLNADWCWLFQGNPRFWRSYLTQTTT